MTGAEGVTVTDLGVAGLAIYFAVQGIVQVSKFAITQTARRRERNGGNGDETGLVGRACSRKVEQSLDSLEKATTESIASNRTDHERFERSLAEVAHNQAEITKTQAVNAEQMKSLTTNVQTVTNWLGAGSRGLKVV